MGQRKNKHNNKHRPSYSSAPVLTPQLQQELFQQCVEVYPLLSKRSTLLKQMADTDECYLISLKWLDDWKEWVGYDRMEDQEGKGGKRIGKKHPGKINSDLLEFNTKDYYQIPPELEVVYPYLNQHILAKKQKDSDFLAIPPSIWLLFASNYEHHEIKRPWRRNKNKSIFVDELINTEVIFVNMGSLKQKVKESKKKEWSSLLQSNRMQFSTLWTITELQKYLQEFVFYVFGEKNIKILVANSYLAANPIITLLCQSSQTKPQLPSYSLTPAPQSHEDLDIDDFLKVSYALVVQYGQSFEIQPIVVPLDEQLTGYCEECVEKKKLISFCICGRVRYCSEKCRGEDTGVHFKWCKLAFEDQSDMEEFEEQNKENTKKNKKNKEKKGLEIYGKFLKPMGLVNLGNTCYMNSVLQSIFSLDFFYQFCVEGNFKICKKELEENNGLFPKKLTKFLRKFQLSQQPYSPTMFKSIISYFLTPFQGYKQHDSNDFMLHLLHLFSDSLQKPTEGYHPIIAQNFVGKYESSVKCPDCGLQGMNQELFMEVGLPLRQPEKKIGYSYAIVRQEKVTKGRAQVKQSFELMKQDLGLKQSCKMYFQKDPQGLIEVDNEASPAKLLKSAKTELLFYPELEQQNIFTFIMISHKQILTQKMKAPYGYPLAKNIDLQISLGELWAKIASLGGQQSMIEIVKKYKEQISKIQLKEQMSKQQKQEREKKLQGITDEFNGNLGSAAVAIGLSLHPIDLSRHKSSPCHFCLKKCNPNCLLPLRLDLTLSSFLKEVLPSSVKFQICWRLRRESQVQTVNLLKEGGLDLMDLIQGFELPEILDEQNAWYCSTCDLMKLALKQLKIIEYPRILILHLKRFKAVKDKYIKNSEPVDFPENLELNNSTYYLSSAIVHEGSLDAGHYWAIARRNGKFYVFNDEKCSQVAETWNKNAYILIYEREK